jgi:hypothetical protein
MFLGLRCDRDNGKNPYKKRSNGKRPEVLLERHASSPSLVPSVVGTVLIPASWNE